ncbi:MAG: SUMF1/EgtB/PvdO family nonheme iron enzyme [Candidatus Scalindua sp.]|nr:SUMF1/EgtB/PvdO family nonheme iron enzyme [Candidatus Scalindua sp.]
MYTIRIEYIRQAVISSIFSVALMMAVHAAVMPVVSAQEKELPPEIQVDILISAAEKDILAGKWKDAVRGLEKALKLGVKLPGEFHFHYGKALFKTGNYDDSLSSLTSYLTLVGKDGEYYEEAVTLVVDAKDEQEDAKLRSSESKHQRTEAAGETEDNMVYIKGGCFDMGNIFGDEEGESNEKPVHTVCVDDFYLGKTEVTQKQWTDIMGYNPSRFKGGDSPVERVSWNSVQDFIKKLNKSTGMNYRLPTEAEWEYAARNGGGKEKWAGADEESELDEYAWYYRNSAKDGTHAVAGKKPNGLGLYDMMGNVWEWCSDWYDRNYYENSPAKNPQGPSDGLTRVLRGGAWISKPPNHLRTVDRNDFDPDIKKFATTGFRLARDQ